MLLLLLLLSAVWVETGAIMAPGRKEGYINDVSHVGNHLSKLFFVVRRATFILANAGGDVCNV